MDALICNQCGARLEVAPTTKYVTCAHCNTVLEIKRTDSASFTEALGPAPSASSTEEAENPWPHSRQVQTVRKFLGAEDVALEEELNRIDREWHAERERYLLTSEFGGKQIPDKRRGLFAGGVLVILAVLLFFMFRALPPNHATEVGPFISGFILMFGVGLGWFQYSKGVDYERAHAAYQARRNAAIAKYRH
jgi:hypothetical protein